ncbi:phage antirepressor N-terminal domain-containing protein [Undibacterium sp. TS12]|uniref:phage antirepressor N-terminal domain-containing protein n=1 Tax=Undibacterium sp. TS12 TaxID=2908202 RepID=UPI001F4CE56A|nr:phage antirepressor N-terminal domain-containing protein [Undibacterium sp. TS12]MCH8622901.1 phage antirepressor N-terminal domain-containing protein [Undibacterium sp. TS12]
MNKAIKNSVCNVLIIQGIMPAPWSFIFPMVFSNQYGRGLVYPLRLSLEAPQTSPLSRISEKIASWLMTISPNKVTPDLKDKIILYQNECDDVLWNHWTKEDKKDGIVQIPILAPREPMPQLTGNSSIRLKMRDVLTMQQQCRDRMREIEKTESPAIRAGLFEQLRFIADQIGHNVPDLDHFAFPPCPPPLLPAEPAKLIPLPGHRQPTSVNQFWDIVRQLEN